MSYYLNMNKEAGIPHKKLISNLLQVVPWLTCSQEKAQTSLSSTWRKRRKSEAILLASTFLPADGFLSYLRSAQDVKKAIETDPACKGRKCLLQPADLMDSDKCKEVVEKHIKEFGHLEILVNNVGVSK